MKAVATSVISVDNERSWKELDELTRSLSKTAGVISADFNHATDKLIIRYDADVITLTQIKQGILKKH
jgi:hypothetical protein